MIVKPRIVAISETGSKIDVVINVDGKDEPMQRFHVSEMLEGGEPIENAWMLARYTIRQQLKARGRSKPDIQQIKTALDAGAEVVL